MICNKNYLADILRVCEIKDLIWVMRFKVLKYILMTFAFSVNFPKPTSGFQIVSEYDQEIYSNKTSKIQ